MESETVVNVRGLGVEQDVLPEYPHRERGLLEDLQYAVPELVQFAFRQPLVEAE